MNTATLHRRVRRQMPWLTPTYAGDTDIPILRRPPLHDIDRIAALGATDALPTPEADTPLLARPIEMPAIRRPPAVIHSEGRPTPIVLGTDDPEQQILARRRALEVYQPQKESKKSLALRTILNFVGGGIPGAVGTLIGPAGILDRRGKDRAWQAEQLGQVDAQYGRMRADRRAGLQDDLLESQVRENQAQAAKAMQPPPVKPPPLARRIPPVEQVDEAGNKYLADAETGEPLLDAKGNLRYTGRAKVPPVKPEKPDTSEFTNQQIERTISEIEAEQKTLGPSPPTEIPDVNQYGEVVGKKLNPAYTDWARRYRELDDQKRQLRLKRKPTATTAPPVTRRSSGRKWSASKWAAANPSGDLSKAKAEAARQGLRVVE